MNLAVVGPFFGDEGKGQTVHNYCKRLSGGTVVIRFSGGPQSGHTVRYKGTTHIFSNFGSGTLLDLPTYWSHHCVIDPVAAICEREDLKKLGHEPFVIYNPNCEVLLPYDKISQVTDSINLMHGTVGTGYKKCLDRVKAGFHLTILDCMNLHVLKYKVGSMLVNYYGNLTTDDGVTVNIDQWCYDVYDYFHSVAVWSYAGLGSYDNLVFEGSQGILLDQTYGIMPYCTPSNTTCRNIVDIIGSANVIPIYPVRPYITRHGSGPIPSPNQSIDVVDTTNVYNDFQKSLHAVEFDIELLKHSIMINESSYLTLDSGIIAVNHMDEFPDFRLNIPGMRTDYWTYDKKFVCCD